MKKIRRTLLCCALLAAGAGALIVAPAASRPSRVGAQPTDRKLPLAARYTWRNVEIVGGGFVTGILFHPKQPDLIYARTDIGGVYRWNPATRRWIPLLDWLPRSDWNLYGIESVGLDPTDPNRLYIAAGTYTNDWAGNGAILRSTDQGRTWKRSDLPYKLGGNEDGRSIGERLAVEPGKKGVLYFGTRHNGLWKSEDYAATWHQVTTFPVTGRTNGIGIGFVLFQGHAAGGPSAGSSAQTLYVGVAAPGVNLYRSRDDGRTWEAVPGQPQGLLPHHGALAADGSLYLSYGNAPGPNGMSNGAVWKYDTGTDAWTDITPVRPGSGGQGAFGYAGLTVDPAHPGAVMVATMDKWSTGDDIYRTTDGGAHWVSLKAKAIRDSSASPFLNWDRPTAEFGHWIGALAVDPFHPGHVLYGTGATLWGSDDVTAADSGQATHWTVRAQGLEETATIDLISPPQGAHLLSGLGDIGGFRHDDLSVSPRGGMWTNPLLSNTDGLDYAQRNPTLVVRVGRAYGRTIRGATSTDGGTKWTPFGSEPPGSQGGGSVAIGADGKSILWATEHKPPYATTDGGATWQPCEGAPADVRVVADRVDPRCFYAVESRGAGIYRSADGGAHFTRAEASQAGGNPLPSGHGTLRATPFAAGDLWLPGNNGLYHSTDGGKTFTRLDDVQRADTLGYGKAAPGQGYPAIYLLGKIGAVEGIYRSDDAGLTWVHLDDALHQFATGNTIIGDPRLYGRVYLGTNGRGVLYGEPAGATSVRQRRFRSRRSRIARLIGHPPDCGQRHRPQRERALQPAGRPVPRRHLWRDLRPDADLAAIGEINY